ncbi:MAG: cupin domain-containing protein [Chloroflexota bacterium]
MSVKVIKAQEVTAYSQEGGNTRILVDDLIGSKNVVILQSEIKPGFKFSEHTRDNEEILFILEGEMVVEVTGGESYRLTPGMLIFVPPGVKHRHINPGTVLERHLGILAPPGTTAEGIRKRPK